MRMSSGLEKYLPFDCLNINELGNDAHEYPLECLYIYRSYCPLIDLISVKKSHIISAGDINSLLILPVCMRSSLRLTFTSRIPSLLFKAHTEIFSFTGNICISPTNYFTVTKSIKRTDAQCRCF